jgi:hypothetical protein
VGRLAGFAGQRRSGGRERGLSMGNTPECCRFIIKSFSYKEFLAITDKNFFRREVFPEIYNNFLFFMHCQNGQKLLFLQRRTV